MIGKDEKSKQFNQSLEEDIGRIKEGLTGNVDGDPAGLVDIGDLTALIAYLYIPPNPVPDCPEEANVDGDLAGLIDIGDLTALIAYLYIPPNPLPAPCQ